MKNLKENERIDDLEYKGLKIIQNKDGFCFGIDSILLTDFAKEIKKGSKIIDLGTGTGIIGILLCKKIEDSKIVGVEIQKEVYEMAKRSIKLNKLEKQIEIINDDIKNIEFPINSFDIITCNPPFFEVKKSSHINKTEYKTLARHEITLNLEQILEISRKLLKNGGILGLVHRPERLTDILSMMRENKIEPKRIRLVYPKTNSEANIVLIEGVLNGRKGLKILPPLISHKENGEYTEEIKKYFEEG